MTSTSFNVGLTADRASSKNIKKNTSMSSDSESDEDYMPSCKELKDGENMSEENSDSSKEEGGERNSAKSRRLSHRRKKQTKSEAESSANANSPSEQMTAKQAEHNVDDLWNEFKKDLDSRAQKVAKTSVGTNKDADSGSTSITTCQEQPTATPKTKTVTEIFEFAGEAVEVQKEIPVDQPSPSSLKTGVKRTPAMQKAGLSSVLNHIGKKSKLSVLEKSKLDWNNFKKEEGIVEELQKFNKGKNGYLEKQDFLQRTDLRQFEIEKGMRSTSRRLK